MGMAVLSESENGQIGNDSAQQHQMLGVGRTSMRKPPSTRSFPWRQGHGRLSGKQEERDRLQQI